MPRRAASVTGIGPIKRSLIGLMQGMDERERLGWLETRLGVRAETGHGCRFLQQDLGLKCGMPWKLRRSPND